MLRAEASSPAYHIQINKDVFRLIEYSKKRDQVREPAAPMRAVEEVKFRPADGPGQDSAGALDCGHILGGLPDDQVHGSGQ